MFEPRPDIRQIRQLPGTKRLDDAREQLVNEVIEERYLTRSRANAEEICRIVHRRCVEGGLKPVSRNAVRARINRLDLKRVAQARHGRKSAQNRYAQRLGHFPLDRILQSVQIDHALADVIVVDERDRISIGRPWLTLAVDVYSRCVLGFYVSLDCPAATSIGLCLTQACLPKQPWLQASTLDLEWPMCGLPSVLRADDGKDFHSDALRRGCREHGIELELRPIAPLISAVTLFLARNWRWITSSVCGRAVPALASRLRCPAAPRTRCNRRKVYMRASRQRSEPPQPVSSIQVQMTLNVSYKGTVLRPYT